MNFLNIKIFIPEMGSHLTFAVFLLRFVLLFRDKRHQTLPHPALPSKPTNEICSASRAETGSRQSQQSTMTSQIAPYYGSFHAWSPFAFPVHFCG